ncbi:aromatic prenyltransferase [Paraphaeosphaeria sporulosa]|uniref:Aromatic prenyltransferase n=1 Tax=Paraphaeosphaeria sporulosa TaxID=1460663 RepID=A0A177CWG6_9PLEO|nr:aromatic prenyltransferase [Paraphaeosphaeria sporulosa]OAG11210.1 aromatic prenyltransferase [Paraphaeosphaeria sporulosa]
MSVAVESSTFQSLKPNGPFAESTSLYWWETSGRDLARMLQEANYPADAQRQFLVFFRDTICPALGARPERNSLRSGVGWDGNPFEYSFELKNSSAEVAVRFVVDVSALRPADEAHPLSIKNFETVLNKLSNATPGFDDTWYKSLERWFVHSKSSSEEQKNLVSHVGYRMPMILGFDINRRLPTSDSIPVMAKVYFPPCFTAAAEGITRWAAVRRGVHQLPNIESHPNILRSLALIQEYLDTKPKEYENGPRYLATDFVMMDKARLKIYFRHPATDFEDIWDYYTLGGRIPGLDEDKEKFRELMSFTSYHPDPAAIQNGDKPHYTAVQRKMTAIYFSLSTDNPTPAPKICFYPANFAQNDEVIGDGVDSWLQKYGWNTGGKPIKQRVSSVFTHRNLSDDTGIFTFLGIGRKEDPSKKDLSMQCYVTGELYRNPRM